MTPSDVRRALPSALERNGFERVGPRNASRWLLLPDTEVVPYFSPDVVAKHGGVFLLGCVGTYMPSFESTTFTKGEGDSVLVAYIRNFPLFFDPDFVKDTDVSLNSSIRKILDLIEAFPRTLDQLVNNLLEGKIGECRSRSFIRRGDRWNDFVAWLAQQGYRRTEELLVFKEGPKLPLPPSMRIVVIPGNVSDRTN